VPKFGTRSAKNLAEADTRLQRLFNEVIIFYDCSVIEGYRTNKEQEKLFHSGKSKLRAGQSKHNQHPSKAVDVVPYPIDWNDMNRFYHFVGFVKATAIQLGIPIRCGADWDGDNDFTDQNFHDLPHFELEGE